MLNKKNKVKKKQRRIIMNKKMTLAALLAFPLSTLLAVCGGCGGCGSRMDDEEHQRPYRYEQQTTEELGESIDMPYGNYDVVPPYEEYEEPDTYVDEGATISSTSTMPSQQVAHTELMDEIKQSQGKKPSQVAAEKRKQRAAKKGTTTRNGKKKATTEKKNHLKKQQQSMKQKAMERSKQRERKKKQQAQLQLNNVIE